MKKILCVMMTALALIFGAFAQEAVTTVKLTMTDGVKGNVSLFKDWKSADKFIKANQPQAASVLHHYRDGKVEVSDSRKSKEDYILSPANFNAKKENEPGNLINKSYKEADSEVVSEICKVLKENGCQYGVCFVNSGDKIVRYVLNYKGGKLTLNRYNYYKDSNKDYQNFIQKELSKEEKTESTMKSLFNQ